MLNEFHRKLYDELASNDYIATFAEPGREIAAIDCYTYSIREDAANLTTTPQEFNLVMDTDSDFVAVFASVATTLAGGVTLEMAPAILIQVREQWSGKSWYNVPTLAPLVAGQGGFPYIATSPRVIPARSKLTVQARAAHAAAAFPGFHYSLSGGRIFYR